MRLDYAESSFAFQDFGLIREIIELLNLPFQVWGATRYLELEIEISFFKKSRGPLM